MSGAPSWPGFYHCCTGDALPARSACILASAPVRSQSAPGSNVQLSWSAPADCRSPERAQEELNALVGGSKSRAGASFVSVRIVARGATFSADVVFSGAVSGTRALSGEHCASLADAVILIVAITLDPLAVADRVSVTDPTSAAERAAPASGCPAGAAAAGPQARARTPRAGQPHARR